MLVANVADAGVAELVARLADWPGRVIATRGRRPSTRPPVTRRRAAGRRGVGRIPGATRTATTLEIARPRRPPVRSSRGCRPPAGTTPRTPSASPAPPAPSASRRRRSSPASRRSRASAAGWSARAKRAGVVVYDDYGHHPTAIRETLAAVRQREPGRRVWAVYEPLTYHRTAALLDAFADVLATADAVAIADIWAGRDPDTTIASAGRLAEAVARRRPRPPGRRPGVGRGDGRLAGREVRRGDAVLVMGGGRSYRIGERLLERLRERIEHASAADATEQHGTVARRSMAGEVSFDVVSEFDEQELRNALDQVRREVQQRYDFKGATVDLTQGKEELTLLTDDEYRATAVKDLIESKAVRRNLSLKIFDWGKVEQAGGNKVRQTIGLRRGLDDVLAKRISKLIRDEFPKVKSQIQGDAVRVSAKSKDDLQKVITRLRELDEPVPLQFQNYR